MIAKAGLLWQLFWSFVRVAPTAFGGGYAMLPVIEKEAVHRRKWTDRETLNDLLSLAAAAPGGVGVNAAAAIGYRVAGSPGSVAAVLGMTLPTFTLVLILGFGFTLVAVQAKAVAALQGIQGGIIGLIAMAAWRMGKAAVFDASTLVILAGTLTSLILTPIHPGWLIAGGLLVGSAVIAGKGWLGMAWRLERPKLEKREEHVYPEYYI